MSDSTPKPDTEFLATFLDVLTEAADEVFEARVYADADGVPTAAAGVGTINAAGLFLAAELASKSEEDAPALADLIAHHWHHAENTLGAEAWNDVLVSALIFLTAQHLEPALAVVDDTKTPIRGVYRQYAENLHAAAAASRAAD